MSRAVGVTEFLSRRFDAYDFEGTWRDHLGLPEKKADILIYGHPGNSKTEYCIQLAKYLSQWVKVDYNSHEQGISKSLQDALIRNKLDESKGKIMFLDAMPLHELHERLSRPGSAKVVFLDSLDFMNLTTGQYKTLKKAFPTKSFIVVSWERSGRPKSQYAKDIEFIAEIKVHVRNFKAYPRSRYGGNAPYVIWDRKPKAGDQLKLGGNND